MTNASKLVKNQLSERLRVGARSLFCFLNLKLNLIVIENWGRPVSTIYEVC